MADVMRAFLVGHQFGQAELEQGQQREERTMRQLILKHQMDRLKLEDKLDEYKLKTGAAGAQFEALQGQPASKFATTIPQAPTGSVAPGVSMPNGAAPEVVPTGPQPVTFPGLPPEIGGGSPSYTRTPHTLEELIHDQITSELLKPQKTGPGENVTIPLLGPTPIASGGRKLMGVPAGGLADEGTGEIKVPGPGRPNRRSSVSGTLNGKDAFAVFDPDTEKYTVNGADVTGKFQPRPARGPDPEAAADRRDQGQWNRDFRQYTEEVAQGQRAHAEAVKKYLFAASTANNGVDTMTGKPIGDAPDYTPPTFEEWRAAHPSATGAKGAGETKAPTAPSGEPPAGKEGQVLPIPRHPGQEMTFKKNAAGKLVWIRTK